MKFSLSSKEHINAFVKSLSEVSKIIQEGVVFNFIAADKKLIIKGHNQPEGVVVHFTLHDIFTNMDIDKDIKMGCIKIQKFVNYFFLDTDKLDLELDDNKEFRIIKNDRIMAHKTSSPEMIKEGPPSLKEQEYFASMTLTNDFNDFLSGMSVMKEEKNVCISGNKDSQLALLSIKSPDIRNESYEHPVSTSISKNFETYYKKDMFETLLNISSDQTTMDFGERLCRFTYKTKYSDMVVYLAKKTITQ